MRTLLFFNNKGGVGKTLTFNLAHMFAREGPRVVALDYDPQHEEGSVRPGKAACASGWESAAFCDQGDEPVPQRQPAQPI